MVRLEFGRRQAAGNRPAHHRPQSARAAALHDGHQRLALDVHPAQQHHVGPGQVAVAQPLHVGVHQPLLPGFGSSAATVISPSGGCAARLPRNLSACLKLQIGIGKFRIDQQGIHRATSARKAERPMRAGIEDFGPCFQARKQSRPRSHAAATAPTSILPHRMLENLPKMDHLPDPLSGAL